MNQMLGNDTNLNEDDDSSASSDDYTDGETSDDNDEQDVKNNSRQLEMTWDDTTMNF